MRGDVRPDAIDRILRAIGTYPDLPAIVTAGVRLSYAEFGHRLNAFAAAFSQRPQPAVLIAVPESADAYAAMIAAGLAGGFYAIPNAAAPTEKRDLLVRVFQPDIIVAPRHLAVALAAMAPAALVVDPAMLTPAPPVASVPRHRLAYVAFTSGSTGQPKGVMISRRALDHYIDWLETLAIGPGDRVAQHPDLSFDLSVVDTYGALCFGATLYPLTAGDRVMPARMIARERITVWNSVPSVIDLMARAGQVTAAHLASVRLFNFCGEPLLEQHLRAIFAAAPGARVQNTYGPTEATVSVTAIALDRENYTAACHNGAVALGDPIAGMAITLESDGDGDGDGDEGQIILSGPQVADGYWHDPAATAAAFGSVDRDGRTIASYRTGDWARRQDGRLFFLGRADDQVKLRGYRVELGEVATAIRACGWPTVCVLLRNDRLVAVVERIYAKPVDAAQLRLALGETLAAYAIPAEIIAVEQMPLTDRGKIDRAAVGAVLDAG